jgi:hypothetical protein
MPSVGFKPTVAVGERLWTYTSDRMATGTGFCVTMYYDSEVNSTSDHLFTVLPKYYYYYYYEYIANRI